MSSAALTAGRHSLANYASMTARDGEVSTGCREKIRRSQPGSAAASSQLLRSCILVTTEEM